MQLHQLGFSSGARVSVAKSGFELVSKLRNRDVIVLFMDVGFSPYKSSSF